MSKKAKQASPASPQAPAPEPVSTPAPAPAPQRASAKSFSERIAPFRPDIIRAVVLAIISIIIWCTIYNRWSAENWALPLTYTADTAKADAVQSLAMVKAARDGHMLPVLATNIPELGAPFVANWDDYPSTEKVLYWTMGILAKFMGIFAAINFMAMLEDVLAAVAFYAACRMLKASWEWAFAGGLIFAFARFGFAHEIHHIPTAYVWHLPLCLVVARWFFSEEGVQFRTERFTFAAILAVVTGLQNPYNTNLFAQFVLFGALVQWWRAGGWDKWRAALPAMAVIGAAAAAFIFANSNTFLYHLQHGGNPGAVLRPYKWMELYGLKLVDMVVPPPDHRFPLFAAYGLKHFGDNTPAHLGEIVLPPGEIPPTAYIGILGIVILAWLLIASLRRVLENKKPPLETWQFLWIMLYSDIGGLNCLIGTMGFMLFRSTTRYSIWILCILLMYAVRRLSAMDIKNKGLVYGLAAFAAVFGLWDQMAPQVSDSDIARTAADVASDRDFTQEMESRLAPGSMVFQIPVMQFPETPAPGMPAYDHFRPYLYSNHLRYSFGTDKGRPQDIWQQQFGQIKAISSFVDKLESYGFAAIYVNTNIFQDRGESLIKAFQDAGRGDIIKSPKGDLICIFLKPSPHPEVPPVYGS